MDLSSSPFRREASKTISAAGLCPERSIPVIATNAPRKYVNLVSRKGLDSLAQLDYEARRFLPPLYMVNLYPQKDYEKKVKQAFAFHNQEVQMERMMQAMYLWDTAMADSIAAAIPFKDRLLIHTNGRYHSDEGYGITHRLRQTGFKVLTISMFR